MTTVKCSTCGRDPGDFQCRRHYVESVRHLEEELERLRRDLRNAEAEARTYAKGYDAQHERADRLASLLGEAADSVHASLAEEGITPARREYRTGLEARLRAALSPTKEISGT